MLKPLILALILFVGLNITACNRNGTNSASSSEATASPRPGATPMSDFERSLQFVRNGQFTYIYVFSRKDGKPLESQDSAFLRTNAPQVVDWVTTEDKKRVIAGTNFNLEEGNLNVIKKRLEVEDYSGR